MSKYKILEDMGLKIEHDKHYQSPGYMVVNADDLLALIEKAPVVYGYEYAAGEVYYPYKANHHSHTAILLNIKPIDPPKECEHVPRGYSSPDEPMSWK